MGKLQDKVAIITGAASGIGAGMARLFAQEGASVIIADYNASGAEAVAAAIRQAGGQASAIAINVALADDVQAMIQHSLEAYGRLDILVNNAGIGSPPAPLHQTDEADWQRVLAVDLTGVFLGTKYALPPMMAQKQGTIINVASIAGIIGAPGLTPYAAAKAGVLELTRVTAAEYARYNIRCNALAPGWTDTPMVEKYQESGVSSERMLRGIPQQRFGKVEEIAQAALFLADDAAAFVQGTTLVIDGGITIV